jgi:hypothetical protein
MEYSSIKPGDRERSLNNPVIFSISAAPNGVDRSWTQASGLPEVDDCLSSRAPNPSYSLGDFSVKIGAAI